MQPAGQGLPSGLPRRERWTDVHGTAQSVWDVRRIIRWIRAQQPEARIGLNSILTGGYVASLVASLEDDLTCAILGSRRRISSNCSAGTRACPRRPAPGNPRTGQTDPGRMVSPLSLEPRCRRRGRVHLRGRADRPDPREQVMQLWEHWGPARRRVVPRRAHGVLPGPPGAALMSMRRWNIRVSSTPVAEGRQGREIAAAGVPPPSGGHDQGMSASGQASRIAVTPCPPGSADGDQTPHRLRRLGSRFCASCLASCATIRPPVAANGGRRPARNR